MKQGEIIQRRNSTRTVEHRAISNNPTAEQILKQERRLNLLRLLDYLFETLCGDF